MRRTLITIVLLMLLGTANIRAQEASAEVPWWKQQKIKFMCGQWNHAREDKSASIWGADLPGNLFRNVALAGSTVFVEMRGYKPDHARYAHQEGMKYFATRFACSLYMLTGERKAITKTGELSYARRPWCPLDQTVYEKLFVEPYLEGVKQGLIDGIHIDWERYGGGGEADICYCDDCFSKFPSFKQSGEKLPEKSKRFKWVEDHDLIDAYEQNFSQRRFKMFTRVREKLQAHKPDLLFSTYGTIFSDFTRAMNTPEAPLIFLDSRNYTTDDKQGWWESYAFLLRKEGYLYIPGGWTNALFGAQASQVSAARWIYEASINED